MKSQRGVTNKERAGIKQPKKAKEERENKKNTHQVMLNLTQHRERIQMLHLYTRCIFQFQFLWG